MRTFPFVITIFAIWGIFVTTLYLAFGFTLPAVILAALSFVGAGMSVFTYRYYGWPYADKEKFKDVKPSDLYSLLEKGEKFEIIDVRQPVEFAKGHIPHSVNVPFYRVERGMVVANKTVFVSRTGRRSRVIIKRVSGKQVFNLKEGYRQWVEEHLPTEK